MRLCSCCTCGSGLFLQTKRTNICRVLNHPNWDHSSILDTLSPSFISYGGRILPSGPVVNISPSKEWQSVWRWNYTKCWLAARTAQGCICHLVGTCIQSAFSAQLVLSPQVWMGIEPLSFAVLVQCSTLWSTLCHLDIESWDWTTGATVMLFQILNTAVKQYLSQDVSSEDFSLPWRERRTCCKEAQRYLVRMTDLCVRIGNRFIAK